MLQTEFETLTGIFPDAILYEVIEREYNRQIDGRDFWDNKHDFCNAYKFNEDGLASRLQAAANEAIWRKEEAHRKAMQESAERIEKLSRESCKSFVKLPLTHLKRLQIRSRMSFPFTFEYRSVSALTDFFYYLRDFFRDIRYLVSAVKYIFGFPLFFFIYSDHLYTVSVHFH